jgi:hypothetical protein
LRISVALPSTLGRVEAAAFRGQLLVAFDQKESVVIDCTSAGALPALWVQLLCSAATAAHKRQLAVILKGMSELCRSSFTAIGIDPAANALVLE